METVVAGNESSYLKQPEVQKECKSVVKIDRVIKLFLLLFLHSFILIKFRFYHERNLC